MSSNKKIKPILLLLCLIIAECSFSQVSEQNDTISVKTLPEKPKERDYSKTYLDVGFGFGPNYGLIGIKLVAGYKGNGLLIGFGGLDGQTASAIGLQLAYGAVYVSFANAAYGIYEVNVNGRVSEGLIEGTVIMLGGRPSLGKKERIILDLGIGIGRGGRIPGPFGEIKSETVVFTFGFGFKL